MYQSFCLFVVCTVSSNNQNSIEQVLEENATVAPYYTAIAAQATVAFESAKVYYLTADAMLVAEALPVKVDDLGQD